MKLVIILLILSVAIKSRTEPMWGIPSSLTNFVESVRNPTRETPTPPAVNVNTSLRETTVVQESASTIPPESPTRVIQQSNTTSTTTPEPVIIVEWTYNQARLALLILETNKTTPWIRNRFPVWSEKLYSYVNSSVVQQQLDFPNGTLDNMTKSSNLTENSSTPLNVELPEGTVKIFFWIFKLPRYQFIKNNFPFVNKFYEFIDQIVYEQLTYPQNMALFTNSSSPQNTTEGSRSRSNEAGTISNEANTGTTTTNSTSDQVSFSQRLVNTFTFW